MRAATNPSSAESPLDHPTEFPEDPRDSEDAALLAASQIAHDLANVLMGLQVLTQTLVPNHTVSSAQIESLRGACLHSSQLCDQLQQCLAGGSDPSVALSEICINAIIDSMEPMLRAIVRPNVELDIRVAEELPPVMANATQIRQVIINLLRNASDSLGDACGVITVRTGRVPLHEITSHAHTCDSHGEVGGEDGVFLDVSDTGCGISEEHLPDIFARTFTTKKNGHGLGLSSVLRGVHACGGELSVNSRVGEGTQVRCILPAVPAGEFHVNAARATTVKQVFQRNSEPISVLLVEDRPSLGYLTKVLLEDNTQFDATVILAQSGREALEAFREQQYQTSVVVLDICLPDCCGTHLIQMMREHAADLPVIVTSGLPEKHLIAKCQGLRVDAVLPKPFDIEALVQKIIEVVR